MIEHFLKKTTYLEKTGGLIIKAAPLYIPERSDPNQNFYFFMYGILIHNIGDESYQLEERFWKIRDGKGPDQVVRGEGVVGKKPTIHPGEDFTYHSFCPLKNSTGSMRGHYQFLTSDGKRIQANIPLFFLRTRDTLGNDRGVYA